MERMHCACQSVQVFHWILQYVLAAIFRNKFHRLLCTSNFQTVGVSKTNSSLFATGVYGTVKVVTTAIFLLIGIDKLGSRKFLIFGAAWMSIMMFIIVHSRSPKLHELLLILLGCCLGHSPTDQCQRRLASVYCYGLHDLSLCYWLLSIVGSHPMGLPL